MLDGDRQTSDPLLRLALPAPGPEGSSVLVADMRFGWTRSELRQANVVRSRLASGTTRAWLVTHAGRLLPLCTDCGWAAPGRAVIRLDRPSQGRFLKQNVVGDLGLLVTTVPSRAETDALSIFLWRVLAIVLLLATCLAGVLIGASILIVQPLRAITRSVTEWRRAGAYDPRHTRATPIELRHLSRAFAAATHALAAHEERLRRAEAHQELLIKEIHHRVKNNLQIIASLLNLQANRIRQPEARAEFASARDRVRALATLHRHLYSEGELHTLNMRPFLEELCGQLFQAIGEKEGRRIRLEIEAPEIVMSTDQAVPLALVVTEAVSNAIKYAFPGGRSGVVSVRLAEEVEGIATLVIQDNGIGIPAGRAETETGIRDGLGIQLIRGFARQLGATLEVVEGEPGSDGQSEGTRYTLLVPLHPKVETYDETQDAAQEGTRAGAKEAAAPA
jgi:two-component sensor histidine kinase